MKHARIQFEGEVHLAHVEDHNAVRLADVPTPGTVLPVSQRIPAGHVGTDLLSGTAARIFTGVTGGGHPVGGQLHPVQRLDRRGTQVGDRFAHRHARGEQLPEGVGQRHQRRRRHA